jgi:hypothetical protein
MARVPSTPRRGPRAVLLVSLLFGLAYLAFTLGRHPERLALDFAVYHGAARAFLDGAAVYGVAFGRESYLVYAYPPVTLVAFLPYAPLPSSVAFALHTLVSLGAGLLAGHLLVRWLRVHDVALARADRLLVTLFPAFSVHAAPSLAFGQVNHLLDLGLVAGFLALDTADRPRVAGVAFGLVALGKLFPAAVGAWLLRRRAWGAVLAATAVGLGGLALGLVFGPDRTVAWVETAVLPRTAPSAFDLPGGLPPEETYVTVRRPLSVLGLSGTTLIAGAALVVGPPVATLYARLDVATVRGRLVGSYATLGGLLAFLPSFPVYLLFLAYPLVPMVYHFDGRARRWAVAGGLLLACSLRLDDLRVLLAPLGGVGESLLAVLAPVFGFVTPPLLGMGALFVACALAVGDA